MESAESMQHGYGFTDLWVAQQAPSRGPNLQMDSPPLEEGPHVPAEVKLRIPCPNATRPPLLLSLLH